MRNWSPSAMAAKKTYYFSDHYQFLDWEQLWRRHFRHHSSSPSNTLFMIFLLIHSHWYANTSRILRCKFWSFGKNGAHILPISLIHNPIKTSYPQPSFSARDHSHYPVSFNFQFQPQPNDFKRYWLNSPSLPHFPNFYLIIIHSLEWATRKRLTWDSYSSRCIEEYCPSSCSANCSTVSLEHWINLLCCTFFWNRSLDEYSKIPAHQSIQCRLG